MLMCLSYLGHLCLDLPHHVSIQGTGGKHTTDLQSSRVPELQPCSALLTIFARIQTAIPTLNTFQKSWKETTTYASRPPARFLPPGDSNGCKRIQTDTNGFKRISRTMYRSREPGESTPQTSRAPEFQSSNHVLPS